MPDLFPALSVPVVVSGVILLVVSWVLLRFRLSLEWTPEAGVAGNRIYALTVAATDRRRPSRRLSLYLYVASLQ